MSRKRLIVISTSMRAAVVRRLRSLHLQVSNNAKMRELAAVVAKHYHHPAPDSISGQASLILRFWQQTKEIDLSIPTRPFVPLRTSREMTYALERVKELRPDWDGSRPPIMDGLTIRPWSSG